MNAKILHINTWPTGGAGEACKRINKALVKSGVHSKILFLKCDENKDGGYSFAKLENKWIYKFKMVLLRGLSFLPTLGKPKTYLNSLYSPYDVTKHPLFKEADVIHLHWVCKFINWKKVINSGKPIVLTMHDMYPFTGSYHFRTGVNFTRYKRLIEQRKNQMKRIYRHASVHPSAPSQWLTEGANESGVFEKQVQCIPNCIDTNIYKPKDKVKENKVKKILFVAENVKDERKGFKVLLDALQQLPKSLDYELMVLGNGEVNLPNSKSLGFITDQKTLVEKYQEADLYIIPSVEDNLPNTVMESLACGTPVVGFKIGGVPDMIIGGENGFLATGVNAKELAQTITMALLNLSILTKSEFLDSRFKEVLVAQKYLAIYNKVLL